MLSNFFYYALYTSALFIYGIGINRAVLVSKKPQHIFIDCVKMLCTVSAASVLTYLIVDKLLVKSNLTELYPFVAVLIFATISVFIEAVVRISARISMAEYTVSLLCILIGVNESVSLGECVLNSCFCVCAYFISIPLLYAVRKRIELSRPTNSFQNLSLLFISIAVLMVLLLVWNVSWLNPGVLK